MKIEHGTVVAIDYTLTDASGTVLDSSEGMPPLEYLHGFQNIVPGLERQLGGLEIGSEITAVVPAAEGYGERDEALVFAVPLDRFPPEDRVEPGMKFHGQTSQGIRVLSVVSVGEDNVVLDANHELAGVELTFAVKVIAVRAATEEELAHGRPHHKGGCCGRHDHDHGDGDHECEHGHGDGHGHHHHGDGSGCCGRHRH